MLECKIDGDAHAIDRRRETAKEELLSSAREDLIQSWLHSPFAGRVALPVHVGRVLQQQQHAALAILGELVQIKGFAVGRRKIDLEVAGVNDNPYGRFNG